METSLPGVFVAGDCAGILGAENARLEGRIAGTAAAIYSGRLSEQKAGEIYGQIKPGLKKQRRFGRMLGALFPTRPELIALAQDDTLLCRCEEITLGEVKAAVAEGARTIGEVKMATRTGMGNCQGRTCEGPVTWAILQALAPENVQPESAGLYSIRPPLNPLPVGFLAEAGEDELD
jgi:hypothetical protein